MKINHIEYENFKCFRKNSFEIKDLTLITGANSSGKSSLIYGFLGAIQSGDFPYKFSPNGSYVNMGDFTELSYQHNKEQPIKISFKLNDTFNKELSVKTVWKEDKKTKSPILTSLELKTESANITITKERKYKLEYEMTDSSALNDQLKSGEFFIKMQGLLNELVDEDVKNKDKSDPFRITEEKLKDRRKKIDFYFDDLNKLDFITLTEGNFFLQSELREVNSFFRNIHTDINFISSFRLYPERTYYEKSKSDLKVGKFGENYEDQIIEWETKNPERFNELLNALRTIGLLNNIESNRLEGGRFEILVKVKKNGVTASINDVGFGISQFLPIIVADIQLGKNSTLVIAQPEIHLHPSIQSKLADYFVDNMKNKNKKYIIESHSEYFLNRLRYHVVKGSISSKELKVMYLSNSGKNVKIHNLDFTNQGEIKNAPASFFKTYMMDVLNIANNISPNE